MSAAQSEAITGNEPFDFEALSDAAEKGLLDGVSPGDLKDKAADSTPETPAQAADPAKAEEVKAEADPEAEAVRGAVIKTPDGKHEIPARELIESRKRNADLRQANADLSGKVVDLSDKVTELTAKIDAAQQRVAEAPAGSAAAEAAIAEFGDLTADLAAIDAGMAQMDGEAAWLKDAVSPQAKTLKALAGMVTQLGAQLKVATTQLGQIKAERDQFVAGQQQAVQQTAAEAIANNPVLAAWQDQAGDAWDEAVAMDNRLRTLPAWADKSLAERFAEVQRRVVGVLGQDVVPEHLRSVAAAGKNDLGLTKEQVIAAGQAKLKDAKPGIQTLSDLPGGTPAAASIATELDDDAVSVARLEKYFENKSPDDITAMFRT